MMINRKDISNFITTLDFEYINIFLLICFFIFLFIIVFLIFNNRVKNNEIKKLILDIESIKKNHKLCTRKGVINQIVKALNDLEEVYYSENKLSFNILDDLPIGLIYYDKNGKPKYVNNKFTQITGFNEAEIKNFNINGNILNNSKHVFWETLKSGKSFLGFESYCPTKSGQEIPVTTSTKYIYDKDNYTVGIISSLTNITEQERLKKVEQQSKLILDHISDGIIRVDNDGIINGFNTGAECMTGFREEEVIGRNYEEIFIKGETMFTKITHTLKTGKEYDFKKEIVTLDGRKIHLMITTKILRDDNESKIGAIGIYKNITEIEELAYQKQQSEKLAMICELAAGTADEIKNPLTSINGFAQLLAQGADKEAGLKYINYILDQVTLINGIIDEMNLLAKPSKLCKNFRTINTVIIESVVHLKEKTKDIKINTELSDDLPDIEIDEKQIKQAIINVIDNAIQAQEIEGVINIFSKLNKEKKQVEIIIEDHGVGIEEKNLIKIFEPFFTTKDKNLGLGMPIAYQLMKNNNGDMQISSVLDKGTTVILIFPVY